MKLTTFQDLFSISEFNKKFNTEKYKTKLQVVFGKVARWKSKCLIRKQIVEGKIIVTSDHDEAEKNSLIYASREKLASQIQ